jgi:hypothetical protein
VYFQQSFTANETIESKLRFEREALTDGITVKRYNSDNGIYTSKDFTEELNKKGQGARLSGVGGHHHNGVAENSIRHVVRLARTMMIHAALRWPSTAKRDLWPLAMQHAVHLHNNMPDTKTGLCSEELWTKSRSSHSALVSAHTWGSPAYVLEPKLQDGQKIPKWQPRSRQSIYLGKSPLHASTVGLVLNMRTGNISPQFHLVHDDYFETVHSSDSDEPEVWKEMVRFQRHYANYDGEVDWLPELSDEWLSDRDLTQRSKELERHMSQGVGTENEPTTIPEHEEVWHDPPEDPPEDPRMPPERVDAVPPREQHVPAREQGVPLREQGAPLREQREDLPHREPELEPARRSTRVRTKREIYSPSKEAARPQWATRKQHGMKAVKSIRNRIYRAAGIPRPSNMGYIYALLLDPDYGVLDDTACSVIGDSPNLLTASRSDPDTPTLSEALGGTQREDFLEAMDKEIAGLEKHQTWSVMKRTDVPEGRKVLPGTWALKIKRYPDGTFRKTKARYCARGDKQIEGVDYFEKYAPVVQWSTVRLLLTLTQNLGWSTMQIDFEAAFVQADLEEDVYLAVPPLYGDKANGQDCCLKLNKSIYGLVQSSRYWYRHLKKAFEEEGLTMSAHDPCLFYGDGMVVVAYVDDCIFFGKDHQRLEDFKQKLKRRGMDLTDESEDVYSFLGIEVAPDDKTGEVVLKQTGLIKKLLNYCQMNDCNTKGTPAATTPLATDADGADFDEEWNYASAVGMAMYISSNTRAELQFAVHQCARFTHAPKKSHGEALKRIVRYLQGTKDKGLRLKPTEDMQLDMYCDADFAGLWNHEDDQDPTCVKSRSGIILTLGGCPLTWSSKLQTEIALSTLEAEYIALSQGMRELIPMRRLLEELGGKLDLDFAKPTMIKSTVFEDNNGALGLATAPKLTPRTKHIATKYHWFRNQVGPGTGIELNRVDTTEQKADGFTKGLGQEVFVRIRKLVMGW